MFIKHFYSKGCKHVYFFKFFNETLGGEIKVVLCQNKFEKENQKNT